MDFTSIKQWAEDDKPREKMMLKGIEALSDTELLAILIGTGMREKSAVDLARELLQSCNQNLHQLARFTLKDMQKIKGIGAAKGITLLAAIELGRRKQNTDPIKRAQITSSESAAALLIPLMQDLTHEKFCVIYLNQSNKVIFQEFVSSGGVTATIVDIRMILRSAIQHLATAIILGHNHPSGNLNPSNADKDLTKKIKEAAILMDIKVLDHIIVAEQHYFSFADEGIL